MPDLRLTDAQVADVATYLSTLKAAGGDAAEGDARSGGGRRGAARLLPRGDAVRGGEGGARQARRAGEAARARAARHQPLRLLQLPRDQGLRERRSRSAPSCRRRAASSSSRLDFAFVDDIPHTSKIAWFRTKLHDPRIFDQGRVLQPLEKLRMPNFDFTDEESRAAADGDHELPARDPAGAAMPAKTARARLPDAGPRRSCTGATASAATSSRAAAATS